MAGLGFLDIFVNKHRFSQNPIGKFLKLNLYPCIILHVYSIVLMLAGIMNRSFMSSNITVYVPVILGVLSIYLFGYRVINYNFYAMILSWIISVIVSLFSKGFGIFAVAVMKAIDSNYSTPSDYSYNYLEISDLVLAFGYVLIYYMVSQEKLSRKNFLIITATAGMMFLGLKRIAVLGMLVAIAFNFVLKSFGELKREKICKLTCHVIFAVSSIFVVVLFSGDIFFSLVSSFGINTAGRTYFYKAAVDMASFSPSFMGIGRNALSFMLNGGELSYLRVGGIHSDIIKMYVENGFIMFFFWLFINVYYIPKKYKKEFGTDSYSLCVAFLIYTFVLFLTDNTENYFICQVIRIGTPLAYALKIKEKSLLESRRII